MNMLSMASNEHQTMNSNDLINLINNIRISNGESKIRLNDFNNRIEDELEGEYYESFVVKNSNNTESTVYKLTLEQCTLIGMRESKGVRKSVISKIKELETQSKPKLPQTYVEALRDLADTHEKLALQAPKVEFYDKMIDCTDLSSATQVASKYNLTAKELNSMLFDLDVYSRGVDPKKGKVFRKWFIQYGYGEMKHNVGYGIQPMFTAKGEQWIFDNI